MTLLGLEIEEWWNLIKTVVGILLLTMVLVFTGMVVHEGAHIFVALALGCKVESLQFILFSSSGFAGGEVRIYCGPYLVPIAFAGGFVEGLYFLVIGRYTKSKGIWMATLSCWTYALAEVWWASPPKGNSIATLLLNVTTFLTFSILYIVFVRSRLDDSFDLSNY